MSQVLYRQYRPQIFSEVINQDVIKTTLKNAVEASSVAHAYLFTGPRGVGKTSMARILAKAVNCKKSKGGEPCGKCENCVSLQEGKFLDLIEIDAASHTGVDNIREIIEHVKFTPGTGRYKVIVIDEVHMLSKGAFNALLKTLEEPPAHAIFILATTEINKVPATIVSRTQRFDFKRLSQADIIGQLKNILRDVKVKVSEEVLKLVARAADGGMRDALSLFDQLLSFGSEKITLEEAEEILGVSSFSYNQDFFGLLVGGKLPESIAFLKNLVFSGRDLMQFANGYLEYVEMVLSYKIRPSEGDLGLTPEDLALLKAHAEKINMAELVRMTRLFLTAAQEVKYSPITELPLELAAIEFVGNPNQPQSGGHDVEAGGAASAVSEKPAKVAKKEDERPVAEAPKILGGVDKLADISEHWDKYLVRVKEYNHSLISSLKMATLAKYDGNTLLIAIPYRFHKEALEQRKNKVVIEKALEEVYGKSIKLQCCLTHEIDDTELKKSDMRPEGGLLEEALKIFGTAG